MLADLPPVVITAPLAEEPATVRGEVYGPVDEETVPRDKGGAQECPEAKPDEIVVCTAVDNEKYRVRQTAPPQKTASQEIGEALNMKIGNLEVGSIDKGDGTRFLGLRIKF
ncbi:MAG TPA: hypothetical protein VNR60_09610 [Croceibacterium sp.]|nr:hypothetical protein [Croceibacterium sp.]